MKKLIASLFAVAIALTAVPAFACGGDHADETTTTSAPESDTKTETAKKAKKSDKKKDESSSEDKADTPSS